MSTSNKPRKPFAHPLTPYQDFYSSYYTVTSHLIKLWSLKHFKTSYIYHLACMYSTPSKTQLTKYVSKSYSLVFWFELLWQERKPLKSCLGGTNPCLWTLVESTFTLHSRTTLSSTLHNVLPHHLGVVSLTRPFFHFYLNVYFDYSTYISLSLALNFS